MRSPSRRGLVLGGVVALLAGGCSGEPIETRPTDVPSSAGSLAPVPTGGTVTRLSATATTDTVAPARLADRSAVEPAAGGLEQVVALAPDGRVLRAASATPRGEDLLGAVSVDLADPAHPDDRTSVRGPSEAPAQVTAADVVGETVAWRETTSTNLDVEDWEVWAAVDGGAAVRVSDSGDGDSGDGDSGDGDAGPPPYVPDGSSLATTADTAYWTVARWEGEQRVLGIASAPLREGAKVATVAEGARNPTVLGDTLVHAAGQPLGADLPEGVWEIRRRDAAGAEDVLARIGPTGWGVSAVCAGEGHVAWALADDAAGRIVDLDLTTGDRVEVTLATPAQAPSLACGDDVVAWGSGSDEGDPGQYVLDRRAATVSRLGSAAGLSQVAAAGPWLAWTTFAKGADRATWQVARWQG